VKKADAQLLRHGVYRVFWKSGGSSLASVGSTYDGTRWMAPTNWTSADKPRPKVAVTDYWRHVKSMMLLEAA
jgi:hypothetical protein